MSKQTRFVQSPKYHEILACINRHKDTLNRAQIYRKLLKIDKNIPSYAAFLGFYKKIAAVKQEKALEMLNEMASISESDSAESLVRTIFTAITGKLTKVGNTIVDEEIKEITKRLEEGKEISDSQRERVMNWMFKSLKAESELKIVDLKVNADKRAESIFDSLFTAVQYGKLSSRDVVEGTMEQPK